MEAYAGTRGGGRALLLGALVLFWAQLAQAQGAGAPEETVRPQGQAQSSAAPESAGKAGAEADPRELVADMQVLQQRLVEIQGAALEKSTPLQAEAESLQQKMLKVMRAGGFDPMRSLDHIALIQQQIEQEGVAPQEREALLREALEEQRKLQEAERLALMDKEVQQAHQQFIDNLLAAMQQVDPETDTLIQQLEAKSEQLQEWQLAQSAGNG